MLVTLTGAYRNAGDHLIGTRGRALLEKYSDSEIVNVDRKAITEEHYELFNQARAVILLGGPAYQTEIFPKIYPIDLSRIETRVIPMGLGWKGALNQDPKSFEFSEVAKAGVLHVHKGIKTSSVRDVLTLEMIKHQGIKNVTMTGCPAWYKLDSIEKDYVFQGEVKNIALSLPAKPYREIVDLITELSVMFPKAKKTMVFHHGWQPNKTAFGKSMLKWHVKLAAFGALKGWRAVSVADGLDRFEKVYSEADLHLGYRVHSHIFSLSNRSASILVNEDTRGVGQVQTLGGEILMAGAGAKPILKAVENHLATKGANSANGVAVMKETFPTMVKFLESI
jgi:hypothetical protein